MRNRLAATLGVAAIVVAACGTGTASNAPEGSASGSAAPPATQAPPPSVATSGEQLFNTSYKPEDGTDGGTLILGDWQEANQFNPFYLSQQTEANVAAATWATLVVFTQDYKYAPDLAAEIPTVDNGGVKAPGDNGDAMTVTWTLRDGLKWSDGSAAHVRRLQVRLAVGHGPRQRRRDACRLQRHHRDRLPVGHADGVALQEHL